MSAVMDFMGDSGMDPGMMATFQRCGLWVF